MSDVLYQRGSASIALLLTSLFLTSFGVGGQIAFSMTPATEFVPSTPRSATIKLAAASPAVLAGQIDTMDVSRDAPDFLSEVMDISTASATQTPTISPTPSARPTAKSSPKTSLKPSISPKITLKITVSPKPTASLSPIVKKPISSVSVSPASLSGDVIFDLVNQHRVSIGRPALIKDTVLCSIAQTRAPQVSDELYGGKKMHSGFYALNLPYWATENIAAYATESQTVKWWLSDYIHKKAIEGTATHSCAACSGRFCSQIFTSYVKK
jgi:uncharacterized protein YkwD